MTISIQPMSELTSRAKYVLVQELGIVDTMRFLNQFRVGEGDYTVQRERLFQGESVKSIAAGVKERRAGEV